MLNEPTITIHGRATAQPTITYVDSGNAVAEFTIANNPRYRDRGSGEWKDGEALFLTVKAWGDLGENVAESVDRGHLVTVTGRLRRRRWTSTVTDDQGQQSQQQRSTDEVQADDVAVSLHRQRVRTTKVTREANASE